MNRIVIAFKVFNNSVKQSTTKVVKFGIVQYVVRRLNNTRLHEQNYVRSVDEWCTVR